MSEIIKAKNLSELCIESALQEKFFIGCIDSSSVSGYTIPGATVTMEIFSQNFKVKDEFILRIPEQKQGEYYEIYAYKKN